MRAQSLRNPLLIDHLAVCGPFGMKIKSREFVAFDQSRMGFNSLEKDDEVSGEGNSYTTQFREYDARLGRWFSIDPKSTELEWQSPYSSMDNNPLNIVDPTGEKGEKPVTVEKGNTLSGIAKEHNSTIDEILKLNPTIKDPNKIYPGQKIILPGVEPRKGENNSMAKRLDDEFNWYTPGGKTNATFGTTASIIEGASGSFRLTTTKLGFSPKIYSNAWRGNQYTKTFTFSKTGNLLGKLSLGFGIAMDIRGMIIYKNNPTSQNAVHPGKAALNTGMGAYGLWVNPVAGALYFGVDAFHPGGWPGFLENQAKYQKDYDKIDPPKAGQPHFYLAPWGAQKQ